MLAVTAVRRGRRHDPAAAGGRGRPGGRARGQRPALRRPRGAPRRARGPAGQRRRAATPCTACTTTAPGRGGRPAAPSLRGDSAYAAAAIVFAVGTAGTLARRHPAPAAGRASPSARCSPSSATPTCCASRSSASPSSSRSSRRPWPAPAGRRRCWPPSRASPTARATARVLARRRPLAAVDLDDVTFAYDRGAEDAGAARPRPAPGGRHRTSAWSAAPAAARRRSAGCCSASGTSTTGAVRVGGVDVRDLRRGRAAATGRRRDPGRRAVPGVAARQPHAVRHARRPATPTCTACSASVGLGDWVDVAARRPRHRPRRAATGCRPARASWWPSPGPSSPTPPSWCSTRRRAGSTR